LKLVTREYRLQLLLLDCQQERRIRKNIREISVVEDKMKVLKRGEAFSSSTEKAFILQMGARIRSDNIDLEWDLDDETVKVETRFPDNQESKVPNTN
jgi:hypothetical protein